MQKMRMISRKYDGRHRDEYAALLDAEDHERLVMYAPVGTMIGTHRHGLERREQCALRPRLTILQNPKVDEHE
jgi:hypothetical protein